MPHHSVVPRRVAIALAVGIVLVGVWAASKPASAGPGRAAERKRLLARREKLLNELVRLERDAREGRGTERDEARRRELILSLENVYGALDSDHAPDGPGNAAGAAA
jgi:hypothetical protein